MTHQKPVAPTTPLVIDGTTYNLIFDFESVARAEELTDRPLLTGLRQRDITTPTVALVRAMLFASLLPHQPDIAYATAKSLVNRKNLGTVWAAVLTAWTQGLAEADAADEEEVDGNPTTDPS